MKWKRKKKTDWVYCLVVSCFGRSPIVFSVGVVVAVAATLCYLYTIRILYNTSCAVHILTTNIQTIPTATIIRAVHTSSDRWWWCCCCLDCLCCTDRITNTHAVDKLLGVFFFFFVFFFISVHFARAAFTFASTAAPLRIIQKLDGVGRTIKSTISF